jgi:pSer/pThr/pTyr-binding forkhead associated (FHA) protein
MQLLINSGKAKGRVGKVAERRLVIGRGPMWQLRLHSNGVSHCHTELKLIGTVPLIVDLGIASRTRVDGQALRGPAVLRNGDRIPLQNNGGTVFGSPLHRFSGDSVDE